MICLAEMSFITSLLIIYECSPENSIILLSFWKPPKQFKVYEQPELLSSCVFFIKWFHYNIVETWKPGRDQKVHRTLDDSIKVESEMNTECEHILQMTVKSLFVHIWEFVQCLDNCFVHYCFTKDAEFTLCELGFDAINRALKRSSCSYVHVCLVDKFTMMWLLLSCYIMFKAVWKYTEINFHWLVFESICRHCC